MSERDYILNDNYRLFGGVYKRLREAELVVERQNKALCALRDRYKNMSDAFDKLFDENLKFKEELKRRDNQP